MKPVCDASIARADLLVHAICDADGSFPLPLPRAFPAVTARAWEPYRARYPGVFDGDRWALHFRCFVVRTARHTILVDAGLGPPGAPGAGWAGVAGRLSDRLDVLGITPDEVDVVVLTHVHLDHIGWTARAAGELMFPNARVFAQRADVERAGRGDDAWALAPLRAAGALVTIDGPRELEAGVRLLPTPGHTAGSQSLFVEHDDGPLLFWGDAANHPAQVHDPSICSVGDDDPAVAAQTRARLIGEAERGGWIVAPSHFAEAFGTLRDGWHPLA